MENLENANLDEKALKNKKQYKIVTIAAIIAAIGISAISYVYTISHLEEKAARLEEKAALEKIQAEAEARHQRLLNYYKQKD